MEPGEIEEPPAFKFGFKQGLALNWPTITNDINIQSILLGQDLDALSDFSINFAFAENVIDPGYVSSNDPDCLKSI